VLHKAAALVEQLASSAFADREVAQKELLKLGPAALPALCNGLKSQDLEVRRRCEQLVALIEKGEWSRKADAYAADRAGTQRHDLPLQAPYEKLVGTGPAARKLFAECVRTNGPFLQQVASARGPGLAVLQVRCREFHASMDPEGDAQKLKAGDLATLLIASIHLKDEGSNWQEPTSVAHLLGSPGFRQAVQNRKTGEAFRRLLLAWVQSRGAADVLAQQCFLHFVQHAEFKEGLAVVQALVQDKNANPVNIRAVGLAVLGKIGGKDAAPALEKLWSEETALFTAPDDSGAQGRLGDQALAASMRLAGKDPKAYGMAVFEVTLKGPGNTAWQAPIQWFTSDEDRRAALRRWKREASKRN
jgi:hypothetical protein